VSDHSWLTRSGEETEAVGARLLGMPRLSDKPWADMPWSGAPLIVELAGELGTGKSTFARGVLRALGATGPIKSPSYTLLENYELPSVTAVHLDLYRLNDPDELEHLGLSDYHRPGFLWLIEWPERGAGRLPRADQRFEFSLVEGGHRIQRIETSTATK
jgi:tRNA threonylcarbamoyladenosine biosynthesis protein TsaE